MCIEDDCRSNESNEPDDPNRRHFLFGAAALLASTLSQNRRDEQSAPPTRVLDRPGFQRELVTFKHAGRETFDGFLARPASDGRFPPVLVIAGNRITEEYIPNTCAALALAGFVGLAPNIFHPAPDSARTTAELGEALKGHTDDDVLQDVQVAADYLKAQPFVRGSKLGVIGFCYGGKVALLLGARSREVDAVVAFHPGVTTEDEIARLKAAVQLHHGTADRAVDIAQSKKLAEILKTRKVPVELFAYEGADHGFLAYTRPFYRPQDAELAWERAIAFLKRELGD